MDVVRLLRGRALGALACTSKSVRVLASESQWERVCRERFLLSKRATPRTCGGATWALAYRALGRRCAAPRTSVTPRHVRIFAKGRTVGAGVWVSVGHAPNCRLRGSIELRVLVQNVGAERVAFCVDNIHVKWLCGSDETCASVLRARVVKGKSVLEENAWAVVLLDVAAPDCEFEVDFLERATVLEISDFVEATTTTKVRKTTVCATFVSSEQLYAWYSILPGGYVTLAPTNALSSR